MIIGMLSMVEYYKLYLPKSKREIKIEVSGPRNKNNIVFDTMYFLDGQNAFHDSHAAFGRSIRATKKLSFAAKELNKRILGIAIYNSGSNLGRINEYTPFKIDNPAEKEWLLHDVKNCHNFCDDLIFTIIPFIEKHYNVSKDKNHRFIYGSSLAAITALYLGFKYDVFGYIGSFSTASFLFEEKLHNFLLDNKKNINVFLYIGKNEKSDDIYDDTLYLKSSKKLYNLFKNNNINTRLVIDVNGIHNEEYWDKHLLDFINFIYNNDIFYTY